MREKHIAAKAGTGRWYGDGLRARITRPRFWGHHVTSSCLHRCRARFDDCHGCRPGGCAHLCISALGRPLRRFSRSGYLGDANVDIPLYPSNFDLDTQGWGVGVVCRLQLANSGSLSLELKAMEPGWMQTVVHLQEASEVLNSTTWIKSGRASARSRIGIAFDGIGVLDSIQFFGDGGVAFTELQTSYSPLAGGTHNATYLGWTAGGGIEAMRGPVIARIMYRFSDYGDQDYLSHRPIERRLPDTHDLWRSRHQV